MPKKKDTKKVVKKVTHKVSKAKTEAKFDLSIELNNEVFKFKTNNVAQSILSIKPIAIKTATRVKLKKGKNSTERVVFVPAARRLFRNQIAAETFAKNLVRSIHG